LTSISCIDETQDAFVYTEAPLAERESDLATTTIKDLVARLVRAERPAILELGAGGESRVPGGFGPSKLVGLGVNEVELRRNTSLDEYLVHDLNQNPTLPLADESLDAVFCMVPIETVAQVEVMFAEVARVLKVGGVFAVMLSHCYVRLWRQSTGEARLKRVRDVFYAVNLFGRPRVLVHEGADAPSSADSTVYAVHAYKLAVPGQDPQRSEGKAVRCPYGKEEIAARRAAVSDTLRCPYCDERLKKWSVPQTPFTEWPSEYQFVCLNDDCVQFVLGWETMAAQEVPGSCRFMYEPVIDGCYTISVLSRNDLRDGVVDDE
jgi:SAM-dependent methyltransferase